MGRDGRTKGWPEATRPAWRLRHSPSPVAPFDAANTALNPTIAAFDAATVAFDPAITYSADAGAP